MMMTMMMTTTVFVMMTLAMVSCRGDPVCRPGADQVETRQWWAQLGPIPCLVSTWSTLGLHLVHLVCIHQLILICHAHPVEITCIWICNHLLRIRIQKVHLQISNTNTMNWMCISHGDQGGQLQSRRTQVRTHTHQHAMHCIHAPHMRSRTVTCSSHMSACAMTNEDQLVVADPVGQVWTRCRPSGDQAGSGPRLCPPPAWSPLGLHMVRTWSAVWTPTAVDHHHRHHHNHYHRRHHHHHHHHLFFKVTYPCYEMDSYIALNFKCIVWICIIKCTCDFKYTFMNCIGMPHKDPLVDKGADQV